jgi:hypothetical protein
MNEGIAAMDEIQRLGELLVANQRHEQEKHERFHADIARWGASILALYGQIEQWLKPLVDAGHIRLEFEPHLAQSKGYPDEHSPFHSQRLTLTIMNRQVVFVPEAMGNKGIVSVDVSGLSLHGQEQFTLSQAPGANDWLLRKRTGVKEQEPQVLTADYLARELQNLVPQV